MDSSKKIKIIKLESREKYQRLFSKDSGTSGIKAGHVILKKGENVGEHTTGEREEIIIVLKGRGELSINKDIILKIGTNMALYIEPETIHDIKNISQRNLEYIFITSLVVKIF